MVIQHLLFVLATAYVAIVIGSIIKMIKYGVRGIALFLGVFSPIFLIIMPIIMLALFSSPNFLKKIKVQDDAKKRRSFFVLALVTIESFPFMISLASSVLSLFVQEARKVDWYDVAVRYFKDRLRTEQLMPMKETAH